MNPTRVLRAAQAYVPLIKFKGHHVPPASLDHSPQPHPSSPGPLPDSFARYRQSSQQHGPLGGHKEKEFQGAAGGNTISYGSRAASSTGIPYGHIGGSAGSQLGNIQPEQGVFFDRSELPARFRRMTWAEGEIEAVESGGASQW